MLGLAPLALAMPGGGNSPAADTVDRGESPPIARAERWGKMKILSVRPPRDASPSAGVGQMEENVHIRRSKM